MYDIALSAPAYGGDALGRLPDGRAIFVPFGIPGENVRVRVAGERGHFARGELVEILQPAPERGLPRCKHFGMCGGCHYQHMTYASQLETKTEILTDQLIRIGHIANPPVQPTIASPNPWNYRNHVQFHLTQEGQLGYVSSLEGLSSPKRIFAIEECHLPEASINEFWPELELDRSAGIERVSIRAGVDDLLVRLDSASHTIPELAIESGISITHVFAGDRVVLAGRDHIMLRVLERNFRVSGSSFFQVNTPVAELMARHILTYLPASIATMVDVYCGVGLFSAFLAPRCVRLIGIESSAAACEDFAVNLDEYDNVELYEDLAEHVLPSLEIRPDAVLVDPPRAGLELDALNAIVRMNPQRLVYVSCDPATLARDVGRILAGGYRLIQVTPFDLFPQTYHIESVSFFER